MQSVSSGLTSLSVDIAKHQPVLYREVVSSLSPRSNGKYVDCTLGAGGHALGILNACQPDGLLLGLDVDPQAIELAAAKLAEYGERAIIVRASFATLATQLAKISWNKVQGILFDLGVSSMQLDTSQRGFSFRVDAPLDMRFNPDDSLRAEDIVNHYSERELANILFQFGDERRARQVARAIVKARPISSTLQLAEIAAGVTTGGRIGFHPATRVFQALRVYVNNELEELARALPQAIECLTIGGKLAVISFQSKEDRIVKQFFKQESSDCICPPRQVQCTCGHRATIKILTHKPIYPTPEEKRRNPRARSARMRIAEKVSDTS